MILIISLLGPTFAHEPFHQGSPFNETLEQLENEPLVSIQQRSRCWNGDKAEEFRRRLDSDNPPDLCASCAVYKGIF